MKKSVLFVCSNMNIGGVQKSLLALLQCFDYDKYDVDLMLFNKKGPLVGLIPKKVKFVNPPFPYYYLDFAPVAAFRMLAHFKFKAFFWRLVSAFVGRVDCSLGTIATVKGMPCLKKHYDVVVDEGGQLNLCFVVEKVSADKKISFFHNNYKEWNYFEKLDRKYYGYVDSIATVSSECVKSMKEIFPEYSNRINLIENIICRKTIEMFSLDSPFDKKDETIIVTVGRVVPAKGLDLAAETVELLNANGYKVKWYFVGPLEDKAFIRQVLKKHNTGDVLVLNGSDSNPYKYIFNADIVVQPSRFEGKAIAVEEAKILCKPIVVTDYATARDQIDNMKNGLVVSLNAESIYNGIVSIIDNPSLCSSFVSCLKEHNYGNENEIEKLYALF